MKHSSFRHRLNAFRAMYSDAPDPGFIAELEYLENRDLDLSVRLGGLLAFNALLITIGTHPISASPGAPLSLDAPTQPLLVIVSLVSIVPFIFSSMLCLRALLIGEEFDGETIDKQNITALRTRLFAAFVHSIDVQSNFLHRAVTGTFVGGALTIVLWGWILAEKMLG